MDKLSAQQRHANMAAIRSKDTKPEMIVRKGLWKRGFRYRLNHKRLPGHPDLVLRKYRTCIFVNGCFWHGHHVALPQMSDGRSKMKMWLWTLLAARFQRRIGSFGWRRFTETRSATRRSSASWLRWVGIASPFGNASWSQSRGSRRWILSLLRWIISGCRIMGLRVFLVRMWKKKVRIIWKRLKKKYETDRSRSGNHTFNIFVNYFGSSENHFIFAIVNISIRLCLNFKVV